MNYEWSSSIETGIEIIDTQHKELFAKINILLNNCEGKTTQEELTKSLDFLEDYTIKHFFAEEQLQQKYEYPDYPNHKKLHDNFKKNIRDFRTELIMKGASEQLGEAIQQKIGDWLVSHIKGQDIILGNHIKKKIGSQ